MTHRKVEVAVIGGGAAGVAAARRLQQVGCDYLLIEAKGQLGGRALTRNVAGYPLDLGCGWLHSADANPWVEITAQLGCQVDKTPPPWTKSFDQAGFTVSEQEAYRAASAAFHDRVENSPLDDTDPPLSHYLEPGNRWNSLLDAVSTYFSGAELDRVSTRDFRAYQDSEVNWRVVEGYGTVVRQWGQGLSAIVNSPVKTIHWNEDGTRIEMADGVIEADMAIVTLPSAIIAQQENLFDPPLPEKAEAAAGLPLGLADKLFLRLEDADEFQSDSRLWGRSDRTATAIYHMRPFGRPLIECYFGGSCADELERVGENAFFEFAKAELVGLLGSDFARRITPIAIHPWRADPFARGSYSYARPGKANMRSILESPVGNILYFGGEACSIAYFSTAHGAYLSGASAAEALLEDHPELARMR